MHVCHCGCDRGGDWYWIDGEVPASSGAEAVAIADPGVSAKAMMSAGSVVVFRLLVELRVDVLVIPIPIEITGVFGLFNIPSSLRPSSMIENLSHQIRTVSGALEMLESSSARKASHRSPRWVWVSL